MVKICPKCNEKNEDIAVVCLNCGDRIDHVIAEKITTEKTYDTLRTEKQDQYVPPELLYKNTSNSLNKSFLTVFFIWIILLIIITSALFLPWYSYNVKSSGSYLGVKYESSGRIEYTLTSEVFTIDRGASYLTDSSSEMSTRGGFEYRDNHKLKEPMSNLLYLTVSCLVVSIIFFIIIILFYLRKIKKNLLIILSIILMVLIVVSLIYSHISIPKSLYEKNTLTKYDGSFFGSATESVPLPDYDGLGTFTVSVQYFWGPSFAWYVLIISLIMIVISFFVITTKFDNKKQ